MQLNVTRGPAGTGKTIRLRKKARAAGLEMSEIISANGVNNLTLELLIRNQASKGVKVICIDECREQQIDHLKRIKGDLPKDLKIHAVVAPW